MDNKNLLQYDLFNNFSENELNQFLEVMHNKNF